MKVPVALLAVIMNVQMTVAQLILPPAGDNQKAEVSQWVGIVKITITYYSPDVHGPNGADRKGHIWGELVPYGFNDEGFGPSNSIPWRAGANESTAISFSHDVTIEGKVVKAGTYALFLDVEKDGAWNWIINTNIGWGSYQYDPKYDVVRISCKAEEAPYTEWLTYGFDDRNTTSVTAYLQWENRRASFKVEVPNVNQYYVDQFRKDLQQWAGFTYLNWQTAADFCFRRKINLEEALEWADKATNVSFRGAAQGVANFSTLNTKASILNALGRSQEADAIMDKAMASKDLQPVQMATYVRDLLGAGRKDRALLIAKQSEKTFPSEKFYTYMALARSYKANGDTANAIRNYEKALPNTPENLKFRLPVFENELKEVKERK